MDEENDENKKVEEEEEAIVNIEPKYDDFAQDLTFSYESKKEFFDELFFKQSRLFKM